jgi:hypothetical protein
MIVALVLKKAEKWQKNRKNYDTNNDIWDRCYDFKIFLPKKSEKIGVFDSQQS